MKVLVVLVLALIAFSSAKSVEEERVERLGIRDWASPEEAVMIQKERARDPGLGHGECHSWRDCHQPGAPCCSLHGFCGQGHEYCPGK